MTPQSCPNCRTVHDVAVYVTGQKILCRCGIRFEVKREDATVLSRPRVSRASEPTSAGALADADAVEVIGRAERTPAPEGPIGVPKPSEIDTARERAQAGEATLSASEKTKVRPPDAGLIEVSAEAPPQVPKVELPGYELKQILGRGGMGEVWRAWQKSLQRTVAIKILPPKLAEDREFVARFEKESAALAALSHPNVISIIDRGSVDRHYYFVMELVAGRSLRDVTNAGRISPAEAVRIVVQICRAVECAHEARIIHRDLKPENILLDERGHVKVADFGLAGFRGLEPDQGRLTHTRVAMGTLNYMAPEQRKDAKSVDGRADLYSVGVILYELLTGELPVGRFRLPSQKDPAIDARLDAIVEKALEAEPDQRYATATELLRALEAVASSVSTLAPADGVRSSPRAISRAPQSAIEKGWSGLRAGLMVIGALTVIGVVVKAPWTNSISKPAASMVRRVARAFPRNTGGKLGVATQLTSPDRGGAVTLTTSFGPGGDVLSAHDGDWTLTPSGLSVTQAGNDVDGAKLIPRAYLTDHAFASDDFAAEVEMRYRDIGYDDELEEGHQHYAELGYRIKGVQLSVFAIPDVGMRLMWRYDGPDGVEFVGNSARDIESIVVDEVPVPPPDQPFKVKLTVKRQRQGTLVEGFVNGQRFARKVLTGFSAPAAKVAFGCRNLHCEFAGLRAVGQPRAIVTPTASAPVARGEEQ